MGALIVKKRKEQEQKAVKDSLKTIEARRLADAKRRAKDTKPVKDADEEDEDAEEVQEVLADLSKEDIEALKELLPYKEALIKIAKGEFEIERIIEEDDEDGDNVIEEDDTTEEITEEDEVEVDEDYNEEDDFEDTLEDSKVGAMDDDEAINDAWRERLNGKK